MQPCILLFSNIINLLQSGQLIIFIIKLILIVFFNIIVYPMKKRIASTNSIQKSDKSIPIAIHLDIKKDKLQKHKHHNHCQLPKPQKKDTSKHKYITEQIYQITKNTHSQLTKTSDLQPYKFIRSHYIIPKRTIAQMFIPNLLRRQEKISRISQQFNCATSSSQPHQNTAITKDQRYSRGIAELNKTMQGYLCNEVKDIKQKINSAIQRKRSKSSFNDLHKYLQKQVTVVKEKIQSIQKKNTQSRDQEFSSFIKIYNKLNSLTPKKENIPNNNPESSEHLGGETQNLRLKIADQQRKNEQLSLQVSKLKGEVERMKSILVYLQLLLFKCQQILQQNPSLSNEQHQHLYIIQKQKINIVLNTLQSTYEYLHEQSDTTISNVTQKLKQQAQSMIIHLGQLRRKSLVLLQQKQKALQLLREEKQNYSKEEHYCEQLKLKVNRLNNQMSDLVQEIDKKDQLTQYLKIENSNIKEDLKNMEDYIKQTKDNYNHLALEYQQANQRIKHLQSLIQSKQDQINELFSQIQTKNKQLLQKLQQIQSKEEDIKALKQQYTKEEQNKIKIINMLTQQKKLLAFQKQKKQNQLKESEGKYRFLQEESMILQKKIQSVFNGQQEYKYRIQTLQQKVHSLQLENEQLYRDIKKYENDQQNNQDITIELSQLYKQLQQQCIQLKDERQGDKKKLRFYEEKVVELAELADPTYYQKIIVNYQKTIADLQNQIKHYQNQHIIIQQNSQEIARSDTPISDKNEDQKNNILQDKIQSPVQIQIHEPKSKQQQRQCLDKYIPFLMQDQVHSHYNESNDNLRLAVDISHQPSHISALSHYDIVVINQNLDTIDVHKAIYPKNNKPDIQETHQQNVLRPMKSIQQKDLSNFADMSQSEDQIFQPNLHEDYVHIKTDKESDEKSDKLSKISKNVNVDNYPNLKIIDFEQDDDFVEHPKDKAKKINDLIMQQERGDKASQIKNSQLLFKNVHQQQQLQAQLRFSGEKDNISILNRNSRQTPTKNNDNQRKQTTNRGNVYIRIKKEQSLHLSHSNKKPYRSSSCYNQPI